MGKEDYSQLENGEIEVGRRGTENIPDEVGSLWCLVRSSFNFF